MGNSQTLVRNPMLSWPAKSPRLRPQANREVIYAMQSSTQATGVGQKQGDSQLQAVSGQFLFTTRSIGAVSKRAFAVSPVPSLQYVTHQSFALKTRV